MAKVLSPLGCTEVRGSIGGLLYSRSRSGLYVRAKGRVLPKHTPDQTAMRFAFQECTAHFYTLTLDQMDAWDEFGKRYPVHVPGLSFRSLCAVASFRKFNVPRRVLRFPWMNKPPPNNTPTYNPSFRMSRVAGDIVGDVNPHPLGQRFVYFSRSMRQPWSRNATPEKWRKVGYGTETSPPPKIMMEIGPTGLLKGRVFGRVRMYDEFGRTGPWRVRYLDWP